MRTTLDIDEDVLRAARELARRQKTTAGRVLSQLARQALAPPEEGKKGGKALHGFRAFPRRGGIVTNERIDQLREEDAY